jgi:tetratricopeptide (TPR) repeat protein
MLRLVWVTLGGAAVLAGQGQPSPQELIDAGHFKRARALVEARKSTDAETLYFMATLKQEWHDLDAAEKFAERAVEANPKEARYHYRLSEVAGAMAENASAFRQISLGRKFKKECDAALALDPNHTGALFNLLQFYLHAPGIIGGDKTKAANIAEQLMKLDPRLGYQAKIEIARSEKQDRVADDLVKQSLQVKPESYEGHLALGNYLGNQNQKQYAEAEQHARAAIAIYPDRGGAHALLAAMLVRLDKWPELDAAMAQAEKASPDDLFAYYRAGNNLIDRKLEYARAERYFRKYLTQEPEPDRAPLWAAHWRLGIVLEQEGRKTDAVAEWQTSLKINPNSPAKQDLKRVK